MRHWLLLLLLVGCARRAPETAWVSWVVVEGPDARGKGLKYDPGLEPDRSGARDIGARRRTAWEAREAAIAHPRMQWWQAMGMGAPPELDVMQLQQDAASVRQWFHDQGWRSATVGISLERANLWFTPPGDERFWRVRFIVDEGVRSKLAHRQIVGDLTLPVTPRGKIRDELPLLAQPISERVAADAAQRMEEVLDGAGYPFASVLAVLTGPPEGVSVRFEVSSGGARLRDGLRSKVTGAVRPEIIERILEHRLAPMTRWDGAVMDWLTTQIELLEEVATVTREVRRHRPLTVEPVVEVTSAEVSERRLSFSAGTAGALIQAGVRLDWARRAIGGRLVSIEGQSTLSYRLFEGPGAALISGLQHGPATEHRVELSGALVPIRGLHAFARAHGRLDTWRGLTEVWGEGEAGFSWRPSAVGFAEIAFRGGYHHHMGWPWQRDSFARAFEQAGGSGERFAVGYSLAAVVLRLHLDHRDHRDIRVVFDAEAIPWGQAGPTRFARLEGALRWETPVVAGRLSLHARLGAGLHLVDDREAGSLFGNRFFLGGPGSMRGFGFRRLGPPGATGTLNEVMVGGDAMLFASLDARTRLHPAVVLSPFVEVGRVWAAVTDQRGQGGRVLQQGMYLRDLQPVMGLSVELDADLGRVTGSVGVRLRPDAGLTGDVPRVAFQVGFVREGRRVARELKE